MGSNYPALVLRYQFYSSVDCSVACSKSGWLPVWLTPGRAYLQGEQEDLPFLAPKVGQDGRRCDGERQHHHDADLGTHRPNHSSVCTHITVTQGTRLHSMQTLPLLCTGHLSCIIILYHHMVLLLSRSYQFCARLRILLYCTRIILQRVLLLLLYFTLLYKMFIIILFRGKLFSVLTRYNHYYYYYILYHYNWYNFINPEGNYCARLHSNTIKQ